MVGVKRIDEKTPAGGDYAMIYFLDDAGKPVEEEKATKTVIQEFKKNGELILTTYGTLGGGKNGKNK